MKNWQWSHQKTPAFTQVSPKKCNVDDDTEDIKIRGGNNLSSPSDIRTASGKPEVR
jgi:hypothetical protein